MNCIRLCALCAFVVKLLCVDATADAAILQKAVDQAFAGSGGAVLLADAQTGNLLASYHSPLILGKMYPPGSLIKLFTTISYYKDHTMFPVYLCPATLPSDPQGCWDRSGHGKVDIVRALGYSCNVYFRQLAQQVRPSTFRSTLKMFGLVEDEEPLSELPETELRKVMVGNTNAWSVSPLLLLRSYCGVFNGGRLWQTAADPSASIYLGEDLRQVIRKGMALSGQEGTSLEARKIAGVPLLGKTGTTLKWENGRTDWTASQGWWIGLFPTDHPEVAILAFAPAGRGAIDAAPLGGKALRLYLELIHHRVTKE